MRQNLVYEWFLHGDVNRDVNRKMTHECFNFSSLLQIQNTF